MAKFRTKPVEVEAIQWDGSLLPPPFEDAICDDDECGVGNMEHLDTPEGSLVLSYGYWIIRDPSGGFRACRPDIFAATYEPAEFAEPTIQELTSTEALAVPPVVGGCSICGPERVCVGH